MSLETVIYIMLPLIVSNVLHMIVVKLDLLPVLVVPIQKELFGANKTWRGVLIMPVLNSIVMGLMAFLFFEESGFRGLAGGFLYGLMYMLAELPNSFIKRRLGIAPGETSLSYKYVFKTFDKIDSSLGVSALVALIYGFTFSEFLLFFGLAVFLHAAISALLLISGLKKTF
jgi:hypothetical protein